MVRVFSVENVIIFLFGECFIYFICEKLGWGVKFFEEIFKRSFFWVIVCDMENLFWFEREFIILVL